MCDINNNKRKSETVYIIAKALQCWKHRRAPLVNDCAPFARKSRRTFADVYSYLLISINKRILQYSEHSCKTFCRKSKTTFTNVSVVFFVCSQNPNEVNCYESRKRAAQRH